MSPEKEGKCRDSISLAEWNIEVPDLICNLLPLWPAVCVSKFGDWGGGGG